MRLASRQGPLTMPCELFRSDRSVIESNACVTLAAVHCLSLVAEHTSNPYGSTATPSLLARSNIKFDLHSDFEIHTSYSKRLCMASSSDDEPNLADLFNRHNPDKSQDSDLPAWIQAHVRNSSTLLQQLMQQAAGQVQTAGIQSV